ncbi:MAG: formylglycine-generating enzyme family protein [SAR202 cluster bacterium]|nr:formylglycine-generating enzyme family protein [SAR202 cluster bacterium]|tara:strand:+ start:947 stop:1879 length:933 start_codon:yes stop_codon:yes gene_type:complete
MNCCTPENTDKNTSFNNQLISPSPKNSILNNMVSIPAGSFIMGTNSNIGFPEDGEGPEKNIFLKDFNIDIYSVTNSEFEKFVTETKYITEAEQYGWSFVFYKLLSKINLSKIEYKVTSTPWWCIVKNAYWRRPEGTGSNIKNKGDHPVVHISWNDAINYCTWANKRLPTEAEWEYAAKGGLENSIYPWGNELTPNNVHQCNIWQGVFPEENSLEDGYLSTAPVNAYTSNGYGLYNIVGNVWEWTQDWFSTSYPNIRHTINPQGPSIGESKVIKGGSYLCHKSYCNRYRIAARSSNTTNSSTSNLGFRCVS